MRLKKYKTVFSKPNISTHSLSLSWRRVRCHTFPKIPNGFVVGAGPDRRSELLYGDRARVECHRGYSRSGGGGSSTGGPGGSSSSSSSNVITCGAGGTFARVPSCEDVDECGAFQCDLRSTRCENAPGSHHCRCREGFRANLECRPVADLGMADGGIPDEVSACVRVRVCVGGCRGGQGCQKVRFGKP